MNPRRRNIVKRFVCYMVAFIVWLRLYKNVWSDIQVRRMALREL